jgi:hypothetical protein
MSIAVLTGLLLAGCPAPGPQATVATPQFSPAAGTYSSDQSITITCATGGATIHYTTDDSTPTSSSPEYTNAIPVAGGGTVMIVQAIAVKSGMNDSAVASAAYVINFNQVVTPHFSPSQGSYSSDQSVTITCATSGATIHYTTDGSTPNSSSPACIGDIPVAGNGTSMTIKAIAVKSGLSDSPVASAFYIINYSQVSTPQFSPNAGVYSADQSVTITCATSGATIHYTTDGSTPDSSSPACTGDIPVASHGTSMTIKAIAVKAGMLDSTVASAFYAINYSQVAAPQFSPAAGSYTSAQSVTIACATGGATIRYTTDGTNPSETAGTIYSSAVSVSVNCTLKAVAYKSGMLVSSIASAQYAFTGPDAPDCSVVASNLHQATVTWNTVSNATSYNLYFAQGTTVTTVGGTRIVNVTSPYTVAGLKAGRTYAFIVTAVDSYGESPASAVQTAVPLGTWNPKGIAGFSANATAYTCLAIDSHNSLYIAFFDYSNSKATVMSYNGTTWQTVGNAGFSSGIADHISLAIDSNNTPYVAYRNPDTNYEATVMKFNGTTWEPVGGAVVSAHQTEYVSLAVDSNNIPYIAYEDNACSWKATVLKPNGATWQTVGNAGFSADLSDYISFAFDSNNTPYVAYEDYGNGTKTTVMRLNGTAWQAAGSAGFSAAKAEYVSLAFDSNNTPYVAYEDYGNSNKATVMKLNGATWQPVGGAGFSAGKAEYVSLAFDSNNTPYVAYEDYGNSNKATVMKLNGTAWEVVGSAGFSTGQSQYISLAIDSNDDFYVAYSDWGNGRKATVMIYE